VSTSGSSGYAMDNWDKPLTYVIARKSGPLRKMVRLRDAKQALIADLPPGYLKRVHWLRASACLVTAAETGKPRDIDWAFESIVAALDEEGWLPQGVSGSPSPRSVVLSNIASRLTAEPLWRHIHPAGTDSRPLRASNRRAPA